MRCCWCSRTSRILLEVSKLLLSCDTWWRDTCSSGEYTDPLLALSPQKVSDELKLNERAKNHIWKVEPSCATTGEGIFEGLAWLSSNVKLPAK